MEGISLARMNYRESGSGGERMGWLDERPQMAYVLPFLGYLLVMMPGSLGHFLGVNWEKLWFAWHPFVYVGENVVAGILLWRLWNYYTPIRWTKLGLGVVVGLVGTVVWVGTEYLCQKVGISKPPKASTFYIPDLVLAEQWQRWAYLCVRIVGPSLVVPVMEELFFRDFMMRALVGGAQFQEVPVGKFTWVSLLGMSLFFGINHAGQWPEGILYGLLMGVLLIRTKSLGSCIVAHGVTNWTLYLYVIWTGDWQFM